VIAAKAGGPKGTLPKSLARIVTGNADLATDACVRFNRHWATSRYESTLHAAFDETTSTESQTMTS
jgi:hypothetical protein